MSGIKTVHQCLFCPQTFDNAPAKDDHILGHFAQEICGDCNQNLIRIGANLYTLHNAVTCIKMEIKSEVLIESDPSEQIASKDETPFESDSSCCNENEPMQFAYTHPEIFIKEEELDAEPELGSEINYDNASSVCSDSPSQLSNDKPKSMQKEKKDKVQLQSNSETGKKSLKQKKTGQTTKAAKNKPKEKPDDNEQSFECDVCGKMLSNKYAMQRHKIVMHKTSGEYFCKVCIKVFSTAEDLDEHKVNCVRKCSQSNESVQFECDICGTILKNRAILRNHMRWKHSPSAKKFKCQLCEASFIQQKLLDIHHNRKHLDIKEYVCSTCGKCFKTKDQLRGHTNTHTGERPFKCNFDGCEKSFKTRSNRETHMQTHIGRRFQCQAEGCGRQFTLKKDLRRHNYRIHGIFVKKYPCSICNEIFPENSFLKAHMLKHHALFS